MPGRALVFTTTNAFEAQVVRARLASEGIPAELRGATDNPYRVTVGSMAEVTVWVPEEELDDARLVILAVEVDGAVGVDRSPGPTHRAANVAALAVVVALLVLVTLARVVQAG